jgi:hypothetical protein
MHSHWNNKREECCRKFVFGEDFLHLPVENFLRQLSEVDVQGSRFNLWAEGRPAIAGLL